MEVRGQQEGTLAHWHAAGAGAGAAACCLLPAMSWTVSPLPSTAATQPCFAASQLRTEMSVNWVKINLSSLYWSVVSILSQQQERKLRLSPVSVRGTFCISQQSSGHLLSQLTWGFLCFLLGFGLLILRFYFFPFFSMYYLYLWGTFSRSLFKKHVLEDRVFQDMHIWKFLKSAKLKSINFPV